MAAFTERFDAQIEFLRGHVKTVVLGELDTGRVAVCPSIQGRVMTSCIPGRDGTGFGWINHDLVRSGPHLPHINPFGGEDRLWFGPEGGPFSLFFQDGKEQVFEHWQTPAPIDSEAFEVVSEDGTEIVMRHKARLENAAGSVFDVELLRTVRIVEPVLPGGVTFESVNQVRNVGATSWQPESGLLSIWVLGMFRSSPRAVAVLPYRDAEGTLVNDRYFGTVPADRLACTGKAILFRGDGRFRSKIGLSAVRAVPTIGAVDTEAGSLTLVTYPAVPAPNGYVDSMWGDQDDPFAGDVVNSYNDDGSLGGFFELETSSPALDLASGETAVHVHTTSHAIGPPGLLDEWTRSYLGVKLETVSAFVSP
ncbi:MAG: DUF6786 family protein [Fimbriimonadaceae bacterium]